MALILTDILRTPRALCIHWHQRGTDKGGSLPTNSVSPFTLPEFLFRIALSEKPWTVAGTKLLIVGDSV